MKKIFTKEFGLENSGCYKETPGKTEAIFFKNRNDSVTIDEVLNSLIPLKDKFWFVCRKTGLSKSDNQNIAISVAEIVLPIFEKRYPEDVRPREAIEAAKQYISGHISLVKLIEKRRAATYAATYAADATYAAAAAYAATYAADAADAAADIKNKLFLFLVEFVNSQPESV